MQFIETIQPKFDMGVTKVHRYFSEMDRQLDVKQLSAQIVDGMKGEYFCNKGTEYLAVPESGEHVPINFSSSGQQEVLWLLNQLYVLILRNEKAFVIIEEPEAHLYPKLQKQVMEFITKFMNLTGGTVFVTTHSPYVLTSVNNLLYGGRLMRKTGLKEEVQKLLGSKTFIHPARINAYKLIREGKISSVEDLISTKTGEMSTELMDEVSDSFNRIYTSLFYLEEEYENTEKL